MPNDFHNDDMWQREQRDAILVPFYKSRGRFVLLDRGPLADLMQKRLAVDTIVQARDGTVIGIEEKIVRWKGRAYTAYSLETESCTVPGHESKGWMKYGRSDLLLYCFQQVDGSLLCDLIDFPKLKTWFWPLAETFPTFQMQTRNRSRGRVVPIAEVHAVVPVSRFTLRAP